MNTIRDARKSNKPRHEWKEGGRAPARPRVTRADLLWYPCGRTRSSLGRIADALETDFGIDGAPAQSEKEYAGLITDGAGANIKMACALSWNAFAQLAKNNRKSSWQPKRMVGRDLEVLPGEGWFWTRHAHDEVLPRCCARCTRSASRRRRTRAKPSWAPALSAAVKGSGSGSGRCQSSGQPEREKGMGKDGEPPV